MCRCRRPPTEEQLEPPEFLGNVYKVHATVEPTKLDIWEFGNKDSTDADKRCFVKCSVEKHQEEAPTRRRGDNNAVTDLNATGEGGINVPTSAPVEELYLFVELTSTILLRDRGDLGGGAMDQEIRNNLMRSSRDLTSRPQNLNASSTQDHRRKGSIDGSGDKRSTLKTTRGGSPRKREKASRSAFDIEAATDEQAGKSEDESKGSDEKARNKAVANAQLLASTMDDAELDSLPTTEMCSGWAMIPLNSTLGAMKGASTKLKLKMSGGSPFTLMDIKKADIPNRAGLWAAIKRTVGIQIKSELEISITPVMGSKRPDAAVHDRLLQRLPPNIILPSNSTTAIGLCRVIILDNQINQYQGHLQNILPQSGGSLLGGDAVLSSLPKLLSDPASCRVFYLLWSLEGPKDVGIRAGEATQSKVENINSKSIAVLRDIILRLWRACSSPDARPSRLDNEESVDSVYRRELLIRELVGIQKPISATLVRSGLKPSESINGSITGSTQRLGQSADLSKTATLGVTAQAPRDAATIEQGRGHTPFNTRELLIGDGILL